MEAELSRLGPLWFRVGACFCKAAVVRNIFAAVPDEQVRRGSLYPERVKSSEYKVTVFLECGSVIMEICLYLDTAHLSEDAHVHSSGQGLPPRSSVDPLMPET